MIESTLAIHPDDVAGHYDDLDHYYRAIWGDHLHHGLWNGRETPQVAIEQLIDTVADALMLDPSQPPRICDVGCGYGGTSRYLAERRDWKMTGLTISPRQFAYAQEVTTGENPTFLLRNWLQNELPDASMDGLISIECVSHVPDKPGYFEQVHRVLKPGARAAMTVWLTAEQPSRMASSWLLEPICREGSLPSMGSVSEYKRLIQEAGLRLVDHRDLSRQVRKTWRICLWRVFWTLFFSRTGWRFLREARTRHAMFVFTVARILAAYYTGAMQYGLFVLERPE